MKNKPPYLTDSLWLSVIGSMCSGILGGLILFWIASLLTAVPFFVWLVSLFGVGCWIVVGLETVQRFPQWLAKFRMRPEDAIQAESERHQDDR